MATTKQRLLITLTPLLAQELAKRAKRERSPRATIAAHLLQAAIQDIDAEEDRYLSAIGDKVLTQTKHWYSHKEIWSKM